MKKKTEYAYYQDCTLVKKGGLLGIGNEYNCKWIKVEVLGTKATRNADDSRWDFRTLVKESNGNIFSVDLEDLYLTKFGKTWGSALGKVVV